MALTTTLPHDSPYRMKGIKLTRRHYVGTSGCTWCKNGDLADDCPPSGAEMRKLFNELRELVADLRRVHELQEKE